MHVAPAARGSPVARVTAAFQVAVAVRAGASGAGVAGAGAGSGAGSMGTGVGVGIGIATACGTASSAPSDAGFSSREPMTLPQIPRPAIIARTGTNSERRGLPRTWSSSRPSWSSKRRASAIWRSSCATRAVRSSSRWSSSSRFAVASCSWRLSTRPRSASRSSR
ncbi:hypothetical protein WME88_56235 [Sorangium sp. So ce216]